MFALLANPWFLLVAAGVAVAAADSGQGLVLEAVRKMNPISATTIEPQQGATIVWQNLPINFRMRVAYEERESDKLRPDTWANLAHIDRSLSNEIKFYASPPGVNSVKSTDFSFNLCWWAMCKESWRPGHGAAKSGNVRMGVLKPLIGPKADLKQIWSAITGIIEQLPEILESAGIIAAGVASGGQSATTDTKGQVEAVTDTIENLLAEASGIFKGTKARTESAAVLVTAIGWAYMEAVAIANPWLIKDGKLDFGKNYKADPQTWGDLGKPGNAYPLVYFPPNA